jgi:crossover junction endodeoxyribonuclease RuvC
VIVLGIDPGLDGGLAFIGDGLFDIMTMPILENDKGRELDEEAIASIIKQYQNGIILAVVEKVHSMPKQGVRSTFTFGMGYGQIKGILAALAIPRELVRPQEWQRTILKGYPEGSEAIVASQLFPGRDFRKSQRSKKPHSGILDAVLIAEYGRRRITCARLIT